MTKFWMMAIAIVACLSAGLQIGCPDGDDCASDPSLCDGADADTDADADGDVPPQYGSLTVTSTPVQGASIELDGEPTSQTTDYTFPNVEARAHSVLLSLAGRLPVPDGCTALPCPPASVDITTTGTDVNIFLGWDLGGSWRREVDGEVSDFTMVVQPPDDRCPNTWLRVINVNPVGTLCLESDDSLSLCKTHASECGGDWTEGTISPDGQRVEFTNYSSFCSPPRTDCDHFVYTKVD